MKKQFIFALLVLVPSFGHADFQSFAKSFLIPCSFGILTARAIAPESNDGWAIGCMITVGINDFSYQGRKPSKEDLEIRLKEVEKTPALPSY